MKKLITKITLVLFIVVCLQSINASPIFAGPGWSPQFWSAVYEQGWVVPVGEEVMEPTCSIRKASESEKEALKDRFCNINNKPEPMELSDYLSGCKSTVLQMVNGVETRTCDSLNLIVEKSPSGEPRAYYKKIQPTVTPESTPTSTPSPNLVTRVVSNSIIKESIKLLAVPLLTSIAVIFFYHQLQKRKKSRR